MCVQSGRWIKHVCSCAEYTSCQYLDIWDCIDSAAVKRRRPSVQRLETRTAVSETPDLRPNVNKSHPLAAVKQLSAIYSVFSLIPSSHFFIKSAGVRSRKWSHFCNIFALALSPASFHSSEVSGVRRAEQLHKLHVRSRPAYMASPGTDAERVRGEAANVYTRKIFVVCNTDTLKLSTLTVMSETSTLFLVFSFSIVVIVGDAGLGVINCSGTWGATLG